MNPDTSTTNTVVEHPAIEGQQRAEHGLNLRFRLQDNARDDVVERVLLRRGWRRYETHGTAGSPASKCLEEAAQSPEGSPYHLYFKRGRFMKTEFEYATTEANAACLRINHFQQSSLITHKGKLHRLMKKLMMQQGGTFNFVPEGYILPSEYTKFTKAYTKHRDAGTCWIVKPQDLSQGMGITLVRELSDLKYDSESVIQKYIDRPLLIGGYKFDLRIYVLVARAHPLTVWLFDNGIVRFSTEKYKHPSTPGFSKDELLGHLTNASIHKHSDGYKADKDVIGRGCKWDFTQLRQWFVEQGKPLAYDVVWERIKTVVRLTTLPLTSVLVPSPVPFEVLGFDVMVDEDLKPWLIETNAAPAWGLESAVDRRVKPALINDMMEVLDFRSLVQAATAASAREAERLAVYAQASPSSSSLSVSTSNPNSMTVVTSKTTSKSPASTKRPAQTPLPICAVTNMYENCSERPRSDMHPSASTTGPDTRAASHTSIRRSASVDSDSPNPNASRSGSGEKGKTVIGALPGQVLSPKTVAQHVAEQNQNAKSGAATATQRPRKAASVGSRSPIQAQGQRCNSKRNVGRDRGAHSGAGAGSVRRGRTERGSSARSQRERKGRSGSSRTTSFPGTTDHSANRKGREADKLQSKPAATEDWNEIHKKMGGFELVYPFDAASFSLTRTTAALYGQPVQMDVVLKQSYSMVKAFHKGCTSRAREMFNANEEVKRKRLQQDTENRGSDRPTNSKTSMSASAEVGSKAATEITAPRLAPTPTLSATSRKAGSESRPEAHPIAHTITARTPGNSDGTEQHCLAADTATHLTLQSSSPAPLQKAEQEKKELPQWQKHDYDQHKDQNEEQNHDDKHQEQEPQTAEREQPQKPEQEQHRKVEQQQHDSAQHEARQSEEGELEFEQRGGGARAAGTGTAPKGGTTAA